MSTLTPDEIRRALHENRDLPHGAARNAQAEALTAAAEVCGDTGVYRAALINQIDSYEYSAERSRMVVPFARLLQEYDRDPSAFGPGDAHSLFWRFKWVSGQIISSPDVPISSVTGYLDDMEKRYRIAGYSERAVRQSEYFLADAVGDDERAERAMAQWRAADRDEMSDCHACETNSQGVFWATKGEDAKAIEVWEPVLTGEQTCMEEPHRVLGRSLLPLLRLGRTDEARSHHLRGYRMARGKESLLRAIGQHIEFCALTGNEARGVEILAEHGAHLRPLVDVKTQLDFFAGVLVLLRRLIELGHGGDPTVPYEGSAHTVEELHGVLRAEVLDIARRFDVRNGTTRVSERLTERLLRAPLADTLPLGVRSAALPQPAGTAPAAAPAPVPVSAAEFSVLVEQARDARDTGHPAADRLWAEVAVRVSALPEPEVHPLLLAEVADHRALTAARAGAPDAAELLTAVRDGYRALGRSERAALAELRLASAAAQAGAAPEEVRALLAAGLRAAEALDAAEPLRARRIAVAELSALRLEPYLRSAEAARDHADENEHGHGHDHEHDHGLLVAELSSFVSSYGQALPDLASEAEELLGRLALSQGDTEPALELLASAADRAVQAGRPWQAADPLVLRAGVLLSLGRPEEAEAAARSGLEYSAEVTDPEEQGLVRLTLADVLLRGRGAVAEAAEHALSAAHWFDQAGLAADGGAQARLMLAQAYARDGRTADAAEVLQSALPDLLEHGEGQAVSARDFLGNLLRDLRESRGAAEQFLLAADLVKDWEDPRPQAGFAQAAADCLSDAGHADEAVAAYRRALELRRLTGDAVVSEVRILRSLAWLGMREEVTEETVAAARVLMDEAAGVLDAALKAGDAEDPELLSELAQTWHQLAQVLDRLVSFRAPEGAGQSQDGVVLSAAAVEDLRLEEIRLWERAAELYAGLGPEHLQDRFQCVNNAAWTDHELGRPDAGAARVSALLEEVESLPEGTAPEWVVPQARRIITNLTA
ncbi:tetratricopeptide repeat protein [Streptomyces sp. WAC07061]|uniref:tetratricopeptide repeat protein n=1 Tax=Streptomyces sp. WAC07061 TaxID=2487410 RepID=UPI000F77A306|nr:tetratricopeptide repeat protein [Streptomyces sp. WAC07061]RSS66064.1 tetratricopeptide repeat protein [Streptomyces sp. WAC07061]